MTMKQNIQTNMLGRRGRVAGTPGHDFASGSALAEAHAKGDGEIVAVYLDEDSRVNAVLRFDDGTTSDLLLSHLDVDAS